MRIPPDIFFQREAKQAKNKTITSINENGIMHNNSRGILSAVRNFYENLYSEDPVQKDLNDIFLNDLPKVSQNDNALR